MADILPYPRADRTLTVGDICDLAYGRVSFDGTQADPTSYTVTTSMQLLDEDGQATGAPVAAITDSVITDPADDTQKVLLFRITTTGLTAGRWRWEACVSGSDPAANTFNQATWGGYLTLVPRLTVPS